MNPVEKMMDIWERPDLVIQEVDAGLKVMEDRINKIEEMLAEIMKSVNVLQECEIKRTDTAVMKDILSDTCPTFSPNTEE